MSYRGKALVEHGRRCAECGKERGLDVHHIDGDRRNNDLENLMVLCQPCHRKVHRGNHTELSEKVKSKEERGYVYYSLSTPKQVWAEWKDTVPRSQRLGERLTELIQADVDGRVEEASDE